MLKKNPPTLEFNPRPTEINEILILGLGSDSYHGSGHVQTKIKGFLELRR